MLSKTLINILCSLVPFRYARRALREQLCEKYVFANSISLMDCYGSYKEFILNHNMPEVMAIMRKNLDEESVRVLDLTMRRILNYPEQSTTDYFYILRTKFFDKFATEHEKRYARDIRENVSTYRREVKLPKRHAASWYTVEVFTTHHGLKECGEGVKRYIAGKDFIDGGAFIGDSAAVLWKYYHPGRIYSFDLDPAKRVDYTETMALNGIPEDAYRFVLKGLSDRDEVQSPAGSPSERLEMTTLDTYAESEGLRVGFVKCDLEGFGLEALKGMERTIRRDRPVLSLSTYHSPKEFFGMKPFLDKITEDLNYRIRLLSLNANPYYVREISLFAYPRELDI